MYHYKVILDVYGGEFTVGSISTPTYEYWTQRGLETLQTHLTLDDIPDVPTEHQLHPWFDRDDLIHTNGVEFKGINQIAVIDASTYQEMFVSSLDQDFITDNAWVINDQPRVVSDNHVVMTCTSWEKGSWEYELIETKEPFDQSKLEFFVYHIDGTFVVDHLKYNGEEITCIDGNSRGTGFDVWFG
jgi:hypothetical protein